MCALLALDLQVECDLVGPPVVAGNAAVVPRILCFHRADDEAAVAMDTTATIHKDECGSAVSAGDRDRDYYLVTKGLFFF